MKRVLIAYVSKTGTTKEIAEEIAKILKARGFEADAKPIDSVLSPEGYQAVIVGAPINGMAWLPEAIRFIESNRDALSKIPTAYYLVSYILPVGREMWKKKIRKSLDTVSKKVEPFSVGMFGGKINSPMPAAFNFIFGIPGGTPADIRDWNSIRAWGADIADALSE